MVQISSLSNADLKKMHKGVREKIDCIKEDTKPENKWMRAINPNYNQAKSEGLMVLSMLDEELEKRDFDVEKLFKNYKKEKYFGKKEE